MNKEYSLGISFRLDTTHFGKDYRERLDRMKAKIGELAIDGVWDEATSTIFLRTLTDPQIVAKALAVELYRSHDVLLVQIVGRGFGYLFGDTADEAALKINSGLTIDRV